MPSVSTTITIHYTGADARPALTATVPSTVYNQSATITGTQNNTQYITLTCHPTGYSTILFQPGLNWSIEIPRLAPGDNIFTLTAYNQVGSDRAEVRTTYAQIVTPATGVLTAQMYVMTYEGLRPMNPMVLKNGKAVPVEIKLGCADATATLSAGLTAVSSLAQITATPINATASLSSGLSAVGSLEAVRAYDYISTNGSLAISQVIYVNYPYGQPALNLGTAITQIYFKASGMQNLGQADIYNSAGTHIAGPFYNDSAGEWITIPSTSSIRLVVGSGTTAYMAVDIPKVR